MDIERCIEKGFLKRIDFDKLLVEKEIKESKYDLDKAEIALLEEDFKWCIIKSYYSMFHIAKAFLFKLGFQEKKHIAIVIVLEEYLKKGVISKDVVNFYKSAMSSRENADYHYSYSKEEAEYSLKIAKKFFEELNKVILNNKI